MRRAYTPYSRFPVGAAGLVGDGRIVTGCNVENASYGLALCAECGLVSALALSGGGQLVAVSCVDGNGDPLMPCGRCRQLIWEHGGPRCLVDAEPMPVPMAHLLPDAFDAADLDWQPPEVPVALREYQGRGTVFVHPDVIGGGPGWARDLGGASGGAGEPTRVVEEAPHPPSVQGAVARGPPRPHRGRVV